MKRLRLFMKRILCRFIVVIEFCHDCGVRQPIFWWADAELWEAVMERPSGAGGVVCPSCFDRRAGQKGVGLIRWMPARDR